MLTRYSIALSCVNRVSIYHSQLVKISLKKTKNIWASPYSQRLKFSTSKEFGFYSSDLQRFRSISQNLGTFEFKRKEPFEQFQLLLEMKNFPWRLYERMCLIFIAWKIEYSNGNVCIHNIHDYSFVTQIHACILLKAKKKKSQSYAFWMLMAFLIRYLNMFEMWIKLIASFPLAIRKITF